MKKSESGSARLWIVIGILVAFMGAALIYDRMRPDAAQNSGHISAEPWNANMAIGKKDAPNKMVQYSDYFCSHCSKVHEARSTGEFQKEYIDSGKVYYEMRIVNVLDTPNTPRGAEAAYCSADQHKYWEYTDAILTRINADYFSKNIGVGPGYPPIELLPVSYFSQSAEAVGMDKAQFESCVTDEKHKEELATATTKAIRAGVKGLPFIVVNDYVSNGFAGGYDTLKTILKAGGVQ